MDLACADHLQRSPVIQLGIRSIEPSTEIRNAAAHQTQRPSHLLKRYQPLVDSFRIWRFMSRFRLDIDHASELRNRKIIDLSDASDIESSTGLVEQFSGVIGVSKEFRPAGTFPGNSTVVHLYRHLLLRGLPDRERFHLAYSTWFQPDFHQLPY